MAAAPLDVSARALCCSNGGEAAAAPLRETAAAVPLEAAPPSAMEPATEARALCCSDGGEAAAAPLREMAAAVSLEAAPPSVVELAAEARAVLQRRR